MSSSQPKTKLIAIQAAVFVGLLLLVELVANIAEDYVKEPNISLGMQWEPYVMFRMPPGGDYVWHDIFTGERVPSTMKFNNYGYAETFDYQLFPDMHQWLH